MHVTYVPAEPNAAAGLFTYTAQRLKAQNVVAMQQHYMHVQALLDDIMAMTRADAHDKIANGSSSSSISISSIKSRHTFSAQVEQDPIGVPGGVDQDPSGVLDEEGWDDQDPMALLSESVQLQTEAAEAAEGAQAQHAHEAKLQKQQQQQQQQQQQRAGMQNAASASYATGDTTQVHAQHSTEVMSQQDNHVGKQDSASAAEATGNTTQVHAQQEVQQSQQHGHEGLQGLPLPSNAIVNTIRNHNQQELQQQLSDQLRQQALFGLEALHVNAHPETSLASASSSAQTSDCARSPSHAQILQQKDTDSHSEDHMTSSSPAGKQSRHCGSLEQNQQQVLEQVVLSPNSQWSDVEKIFGPGDQAIIHTRGAEGVFGPTRVHGYPGIVFEVTSAECIAAVTLLQL